VQEAKTFVNGNKIAIDKKKDMKKVKEIFNEK